MTRREHRHYVLSPKAMGMLGACVALGLLDGYPSLKDEAAKLEAEWDATFVDQPDEKAAA